jgi:uncharacterized RmlC-like cupin family protein
MSTQVELKTTITLPSGATVVHENDRLYDSEHGYLRGWGLTGKTAGSTQLSMGHGIIPPNISAKPHYHPFETAIFVLPPILKRVTFSTSPKV